jgi:hypothetical protein
MTWGEALKHLVTRSISSFSSLAKPVDTYTVCVYAISSSSLLAKPVDMYQCLYMLKKKIRSVCRSVCCVCCVCLSVCIPICISNFMYEVVWNTCIYIIIYIYSTTTLTVGYPILVRAGFALGGLGSGTHTHTHTHIHTYISIFLRICIYLSGKKRITQ